MLKNIIYKKRPSKRAKLGCISVEKLCILYYIPTNTFKANNWVDGFTSGINTIKDFFDIEYINLYENRPTVDYLNNFDFILVKSNWNWVPDNFLRKELKGILAKKGIVISGVNHPPEIQEMQFYNVLWHQTYWYKEKIKNHPNVYHAFGIDTDVMKPSGVYKDIDWLSIGAFLPHKRYDLFLKHKGKKVIVGDASYSESKKIIDLLKKEGIETQDFVHYEELRDTINRSKNVHLPAGVNGGGERAVLESRACGVNVLVEEDNPKLKELTQSPIWSHKHYGSQIKKGILSTVLDFSNPFAYLIESSPKSSVGIFSYHNGNFAHRGDEYLEIGNYCSFGKNISVITSNHDYNFPTTQGFFYKRYFNAKHPGELQTPPNRARSKGPVIIGNDVWIGDNATVLSGVRIGDGACIANGAVVTKDVAPYSIYGGVPAKLIKSRFQPYVIDALLEIKWWNWNEKRIKSNRKFFETNLNNISSREDVFSLINNDK